MTGTDGLGRSSVERLVDTVTGDVEVEKLRAFAALCDALADHVVHRWWWQRLASRVAFEVTARSALEVAAQIERHGLPMDVVRRELLRDVRHI